MSPLGTEAREGRGRPDLCAAASWLFSGSLPITERFVELDPLSPLAHLSWYQALKSTGRMDEAIGSLKIAEQFDMSVAKWELGIVNLEEKHDEIAIAHFEARLREQRVPTDWVRELIVGARNPATGQAHLDHLVPQILAPTPEDLAIPNRRHAV